jgi:hypothetical protein
MNDMYKYGLKKASERIHMRVKTVTASFKELRVMCLFKTHVR